MKFKLIFTAITAAAYLLHFFAIMPYCVRFMVSGGSDAMGNALEKGFAYLIGCVLGGVVLFIASMTVAHLLLHQWWMGLVATAVALLLTLLCVMADNIYSRSRPRSFTHYYDTNEVMEIGRYDKSGRKHGTITYYHRGGYQERAETFRHGTIDGPIRFYYPNEGPLKIEGTQRPIARHDTKGVPRGLWSYYHKDGTIADRRQYRRGTLISSERYTLCYDTAGLVITIADRRPYTGTLNRTGVIGAPGLFPNRITACVVDGLFDGTFVEYSNCNDTLRPIVKTTLKLGKTEGRYTTYYQNGQVKVVCFYKDGLLSGDYYEYDKDSVATQPHGTLSYSCIYKGNKLHGTAKWYSPEGFLLKETPYVDDKKHGIEREYDYRGRPFAETHYVMGVFEKYN